METISSKNIGPWTPADGVTFNSINIIYRERMREFTVPPYFKLQLQNLDSVENSLVQFRCVARGFPAPDYEWYKGNIKIFDSAHVASSQNTEKYQCREEGDEIVLVMNNACASDEGVYACKIKNLAGEAWSIADLQIPESNAVSKPEGRSIGKSKIQINETIEIQHGKRSTKNVLEFAENTTQKSNKSTKQDFMEPNGISIISSTPKICKVLDFQITSENKQSSRHLKSKTVKQKEATRSSRELKTTKGLNGNGLNLSTIKDIEEPRISQILSPNLLESKPQDSQLETADNEKISDGRNVSEKLDDIIERLVEFSNEETVLVSSLAIDKNCRENLDREYETTNAMVDEILLSRKDGLSAMTQQKNENLTDFDVTDIDKAYQKPKFVLGLEDAEIGSGNEVYLNVSVTGYPPPKLYWFKDGFPLNIDKAGIAIDKLFHIEATYSCVARNIAGEAITSATIQSSGPNEDSTPVEAVVTTLSNTEAPSQIPRQEKVSSRSLVDYLRSKAEEMEERVTTREIFPSKLAGSVISLVSVSTANFETAEEDLWSSDAQWDDDYTTVEEGFESADCYFSSELLTSFAREDTSTRSSSRLTAARDQSLSHERSFELDDRSGNVTPVPSKLQRSTSTAEMILPKFLVPPKDLHFAVGGELEIICCVTGDPHPIMSWYHNGVKVAQGTQFPSSGSERFRITTEVSSDGDLNSTKYTFIAKESKIIDAGEYSVSASNQIGTVTMACVATIASEDATNEGGEFSEPSFIGSISDVNGTEGQSGSAVFYVKGQPEPDVTVMHNNEEISGSKYFLDKSDDGRYTLTISNLQLDDEGQVLVCAMNVIGYCEKAFEIFVDDSCDRTAGSAARDFFGEDSVEDVFLNSSISEHLAFQQSPPRFDEIAEDVTASLGANVAFTVAVYGWPTPDIAWKRNGENLCIGERIRMESADYGVHTLHISNLNQSDYGIYCCIAKNTAGEISCKAELASANVNSDNSSSKNTKLMNERRFTDHYRMYDVIGSGAFSQVRLAKSIRNQTTEYAAKYIYCRNAVERKHAMEEIDILKRLFHLNVIAYEDHFVAKKYLILVTEHADMEWFDFLIEEPCSSEFEIAMQVREICAGLGYLHAHGIVHLNIKPENIMVAKSAKQAKIIDFGSAKEISVNNEPLHDFGDPEFVAPEIVNGEPVATVTDMWSLGISVYVALTGISPLHGESDYNTLEKVKEHKIGFTKSFAAISDQAIDFLKRLLVADVSTRMSSSKALHHDWLNGNIKNSGTLSSNRLKYFCSRRKWQRSLVGPRTSLTHRSISSLLKKEYDSLSIAIPRELANDVVSSSTVTESDDEGATYRSWPRSRSQFRELRNGSRSPVKMEKDDSDKRRGIGSFGIHFGSANMRSSDSKLVTRKFNMRTIGKKVSFEDDMHLEDRKKSRGLSAGSLTEVYGRQDRVTSLTRDGIDTPKRNLKKKSAAQIRRQCSAENRMDWSSSDSDHTVHNDDSDTQFGPVKKGRASPFLASPDFDQNATRGILKSGSSRSMPRSRNDGKPISSPRSRVSSAGSRTPKSFRTKLFKRGISLDIQSIPELRITNDTGGETQTLTAEKRRAAMRRGSSVESVLSKKLDSRLGGLRLPLLEKNRADEPTAGMALRRSQPTIPRGGSLSSYSVESSTPNTPVLEGSFKDHFKSVAHSDELIRSRSDFATKNKTRIDSARLSSSSVRTELLRSRSPSKWHATDCYAPFFKTKLVSQGVTSKQVSATLLCLLDASPPPEVTWFKDGVEIDYSDRFDVISEPSISRYQLKIRSLRLPSDFGKYAVKATNKLGTIESSCTLSAAVVPDKPSRPVAMQHIDGAVWIKWNRPDNCAPNPLQYRLEYRDQEDRKWVVAEDMIKDTTCCIRNLRNGGSCRFRARAENNAGAGPYSRVSQQLVISGDSSV